MSLEIINYSNVNEQLRAMTSEFLGQHPALTVNSLALRSGVAPTTLRRLLQNESRNEIAPHSVLALISYILREKKIAKIIKIVEGPVGDLLRKSFDQFIFDDADTNHKMDQDLNNLFKDKLYYLIYKMAANKMGTTYTEIKNNFGLHGINKLEELMINGWIFDDEGILHAKEKDFTVDLNRAHELTHTLIDQYKISDIDKGYNLFYSLSEGLNEAGIKMVKKLEIETVKKVYEVMNNDEFIGSIPYFSLFLSEVIGLTPTEELKREVLQ